MRGEVNLRRQILEILCNCFGSFVWRHARTMAQMVGHPVGEGVERRVGARGLQRSARGSKFQVPVSEISAPSAVQYAPVQFLLSVFNPCFISGYVKFRLRNLRTPSP